jgi:hypothetical protein
LSIVKFGWVYFCSNDSHRLMCLCCVCKRASLRRVCFICLKQQEVASQTGVATVLPLSWKHLLVAISFALIVQQQAIYIDLQRPLPLLPCRFLYLQILRFYVEVSAEFRDFFCAFVTKSCKKMRSFFHLLAYLY